MNWKAEAMEKLRRYESMRRAAQNIPREVERLESVACGLRSAGTDKTPVKGGMSREEALLNNIAHRQELLWSLEQAQCWLDVTERAMSTLSPEEKLILHRLYIYPEKGAMDRLCVELAVEQSSIYRRRDRALRRFCTALYGFPE